MEEKCEASSGKPFMLVHVNLSMPGKARRLRTSPKGKGAGTNRRRKPLEVSGRARALAD
jgi:hypothetical protein